MAKSMERGAKRIEFCCPSELAYGQHVTIVAEPIRAGDAWVAAIAQITGGGEIRLAERVEAGEQLIVLGRKDKSDPGGVIYIAASASAIEAMAEAVEAEVVQLLEKRRV